ncbi:class C beta-lactamase [Cupriavidus pauculus]|uniref:Beta-lactamase n=1 Tax=Cupriavidus pauculus TaxID=82633 RepID=A0A2N5C614_9BURK|nr:class C beta-lactamase [Cupriavidus pauculus]PLP97669.1 class C beta-lactamase [Cupriavidus pauculus]
MPPAACLFRCLATRPPVRVGLSALAIATLSALSTFAQAAPAGADAIRQAVDAAVQPVMAQYKVPGMAVAITAGGQHRVFNYGVASRQGSQPVTDDTLFEIGSVSKTFTATLAAWAQARGALSLDDKATRYLPTLAGSAFDRISLLELGTYTAGGLPLQVPDAVNTMPQMIEWLRNWQPDAAPGTQRRYSNVSIGLFGFAAAQALDTSFERAMARQLLPKLGLAHSWVQVPRAQMVHYAWGYKDDKPVRASAGVFDGQAYGIKTTAADMIRYVELNIDGRTLSDPALRQALATTHTGYFRVGGMTQGLGWERYNWPVTLDALQAGNDAGMVRDAQAVQRIDPPQPAPADVLINKTGSTNGFGAYVAFVPGRQIGVVMLANRNLPIPARVQAAYAILQALDAGGTGAGTGSSAPAR